MEWKLSNALSRDVERQHLNKILKEIATATSDATALATKANTNTSTNTVTTNYAVARFTLALTGAVTGSGTVDGLNNVTITTTLADDAGYIEEAPVDNQYYWRWNGEWKPVPEIITQLAAGDMSYILAAQIFGP